MSSRRAVKVEHVRVVIEEIISDQRLNGRLRRNTIDYYIDRWDEFAKNLKDGKAPVLTIWFSER
jgi:hypothetical protein